MKLIIASDIHGSLKYMNKLEELIKKEEPDNIIILGDLISYEVSSLDNEEVIRILNKYSSKLISVRGNCDMKINATSLSFDHTKDYREIEIDNKKIVLTHGHLNSWLIDIIKNKIVFQGHTHIYNLEGQYINPGSVGLPRQNKEHTCIIYENEVLKLINLDDFNIIKTKSM